MSVDISDSLLIDGWMSEAELVWLAETAQSHSKIIEVGSWMGRSSLAIAKHTPGELWCIDAWIGMLDIPSGINDHEVHLEATRAEAEFYKNLLQYIVDKKVRVMREESIAASNELLMQLGPNSVDWIFLDGDHSYETVKKEIVNYLVLLKPGGLLSGHDYYHGGVGKAVSEIFSSGYKCIPNGTIWYVEW